MEIVLASASPRRRELLSLITEHFTVCPADADETLRDAPLGEEVTRLSRLKAEAVQAQYPNAVCIGSDTMVTSPPESRSTRPAPTASRATAHCSSRASRATITASWVCLWLRFIPFCAIFMRCKPHLPAEIPHFSATL